MKPLFRVFAAVICFSVFGAWQAFAITGAEYERIYPSNVSRSYQYKDIDVLMRVNADSTVDVVENQQFDFHGENQQGFRAIPLTKIDAVTDIQVIDGETQQPLTYSTKTLDKTQPSSWGQYATYRSNGVQNIEWYYNLKDTTHHFILKYKVHGSIAFYDTHDELYWNVFTDYDVLVDRSRVMVLLPKNVDASQMRVQEYMTGGASSSSRIENARTFTAEATSLAPKAKFTIAAGWPKGLVSQSAYYKDMLRTYWGVIASLIIGLCTAIFTVLHWYFTEKFRKGRGVIIAEYDAPRNLPPAMGEVIVNEATSSSTWAATVVDLAVRGLISIQENGTTELMRQLNNPWVKRLMIVIAGLMISSFFYAFYTVLDIRDGTFFWIFLISGMVILMGIVSILQQGIHLLNLNQKEYALELRALDYKENMEKYALKNYESELLSVFFESSSTFSIAGIKKDMAQRTKIAAGLQKVVDSLNVDVSSLGLHVNDVVKQKRGSLFVGVVYFVVMTIFIVLSKKLITFEFSSGQVILFVIVLAICLTIIGYRVFFDARLNATGNVEREAWLGFKLYLETAEKYRMQNLTPDIFEKFLSYAMIFGLEKRWAAHFSSLAMQQPKWYASSSSGVSAGSSSSLAGNSTSSFSGASSFSATAFSASLSSSLSSALSSAGASSGGASGGGGSAGGGGGGGGGGAS